MMSTVVLVTLYTLTSVTVLLGTAANTTQLLHTEGIETALIGYTCYAVKALDTSVTQ